MKNPFVYGEEVSGEAFCDRHYEIEELLRDARNGQNLLIYSPRRYGKTSLIKRVLEILEQEGFLTVYVDLYPAISKETFIDVFASAIAKSIKGTIKSVLGKAREILPLLVPKLIIKDNGAYSFEFGYDRTKDIRPVLDDLLYAAKRECDRTKRQGVVAFDEFQEITNYEDDEVERRMRSVFQTHRDVSYIFLGGKRHIMRELFYDPNRPFYKSAKHFPIGKIEEHALKGFVKGKFTGGGIEIDDESIDKIIAVTESHPYYTQHLCHIIWNECVNKRQVEGKDVNYAVSALIRREGEVCFTIWDSLTKRQKQLLYGLSSEESPEIFSGRFVKKYGLNSPSTIRKSIQVLYEKGLVEKDKDKYKVSDIFFRIWLKEFFKL